MKTLLLQGCQTVGSRTGTAAWNGFRASGVSWVVALLVFLAAAATVCGFATFVDTVQGWAVLQTGAYSNLQ